MSPPSTMKPSRTCCLISKHLWDVVFIFFGRGERKRGIGRWEVGIQNASIKAFYLEYHISHTRTNTHSYDSHKVYQWKVSLIF